MRDAHRRVGGVDALTALAGRPVHVDAEVGLVDLYFLDLFGFGVDQHAGRRGVHAALRLGDRDPLHAVHAALELQPRPDAVGGIALAPDRQRGVLVAAQVRSGLVEHRHGPAVPLGVPDVHPGQVGGEQRGLLAALTGLHLEDDVVGVVRVARGKQVGQMGVEFVDGCAELVDLGGEGVVVCAPVHGRPRDRRGRPPACGRSPRSAPTARTACRPCGPYPRPSAGWGRRADARGRRARTGWRQSLARCPSSRPPSPQHTLLICSLNAKRRPACARAADRALRTRGADRASVRQLFVG